MLSAWNFLTVNVIKWLPFLIHPGIFSYIPTWSKKTDNSLFFRHQNWAWLVFHNMKWSFGNFSYSNHWNGKQNWDFSNFKNQNRHYQLMFRCRFFGDNRKILKGPSIFLFEQNISRRTKISPAISMLNFENSYMYTLVLGNPHVTRSRATSL